MKTKRKPRHVFPRTGTGGSHRKRPRRKSGCLLNPFMLAAAVLVGSAMWAAILVPLILWGPL